MQACQETSHLGLLILVSKDYFFFPWNTYKLKILYNKMGRCPTRGQDSFLLCFLSSSQTLVEFQTRNLSILHRYFMAWVLGTSLCAPGPAIPQIQNLRKPLVWGHVLVTPRPKTTTRWGDGTLVCRVRGTHCSLWHSLHVLLDWGDLQNTAFSPTSVTAQISRSPGKLWSAGPSISQDWPCLGWFIIMSSWKIKTL